MLEAHLLLRDHRHTWHCAPTWAAFCTCVRDAASCLNTTQLVCFWITYVQSHCYPEPHSIVHLLFAGDFGLVQSKYLPLWEALIYLFSKTANRTALWETASLVDFTKKDSHNKAGRLRERSSPEMLSGTLFFSFVCCSRCLPAFISVCLWVRVTAAPAG